MGKQIYFLDKQKFGRLYVIARDYEQNNKKEIYWKCLCDCGNFCIRTTGGLIHKQTKSCGCLPKEIVAKRHKSRAIKSKHFNRAWFNQKVIKSSKKRNLECNITMEYLDEIYDKQNGICKLSGIQLTLPKSRNDIESNISVDRIDSNLGYIKDNIQLTTKKVNMSKQGMSNKEYIDLCKNVAIIHSGPSSDIVN